MNIITKKITLRLCVLMLSVLTLTFTLIGCPTADSSSGDSSSSSNNNNNNNSSNQVCGLDNPEKINVLSQDVGLRHILLDICTNEDIDEIGFAVNTTQAPVAKNTISTKYGYITRKFTKGVTRQIFFTVKTDATSDNALTVAADGLAPNTQYYVHMYYGTETKSVAYTTAKYHITQDADPGDGFFFSPPHNMTYELKITEPFILTYYLKFLATGQIYFYINNLSRTTCDGTLCNPPNNANGTYSTATTGAHNMGYVTVVSSGTTVARFDNKTEGILLFSRDAGNGNPKIDSDINYKVVME